MWWSAVLFADALAGGRPSFSPALEEYGFPAQKVCFPSGLQVVVASDPTFPVASATVVVEGGQASGQVAHLVEHLWFRSRPGGGPEIEHRLDALGISHNAFTDIDHRAYGMIGPASALGELGKATADLLLRPLAGIDEDVAEVERELVRHESELRGRPTGEVAWAEVARRLFPAPHPLSALAVGPVPTEDLAAIQAWSSAHDGPRNATVYLVGDFPLEAGMKQFLDALPDAALVDPKNPKAPLAAAPCPSRTGVEIPLPTPVVSRSPGRVPAPIDDPEVVMAWALPGAWRGKDALASVGARLFEQILEYQILQLPKVARAMRDGELLSACDCSLESARDASVLWCSARLGPGRTPEQVIGAARMAVDLVTARSLVANDALGEWLTDAFISERIEAYSTLEDLGSATHGRAAAAAVHLHRTGSSTMLRDELAEQQAFSEKALSELFRAHLTFDRMVTFVLEPAPVAPAKGSPVTALATPSTMTAAPADAATLRAIAAMPQVPAPTRLENGLSVLVVPLGAVPRVHVSLWLPGGNWRAPPGVAELGDAVTSWFYATQTTSAYQRPREFLGGWRRGLDQGGTVIELAGLSGNLEAAVWSVRDLVDHAEPVRADLSPLVKFWTGWLDDPGSSVQAEAKLWEAAWPELAPLGPADAGALAAVPFEDLVAWQDRVVIPEGALLLIVGRVDPAAGRAAAERWFGDWRDERSPYTSTGPAPPPPGPSLAPRRMDHVSDPTVPSAEVQLVCVLPELGMGAARVAEQALDALVWDAARASRALTYDPDVWSMLLPGGVPAIGFGATVAPGDAGTLVETWDGALRTLGTLDAPRQARAKRAAAAALRSTFTSVDGAQAALGATWLAAQSTATLEHAADDLGAVDTTALAAVATACLDHEQYVVVGPGGG